MGNCVEGSPGGDVRPPRRFPVGLPRESAEAFRALIEHIGEDLARVYAELPGGPAPRGPRDPRDGEG